MADVKQLAYFVDRDCERAAPSEDLGLDARALRVVDEDTARIEAHHEDARLGLAALRLHVADHDARRSGGEREGLEEIRIILRRPRATDQQRRRRPVRDVNVERN